ncbi:molecular chaperone [Sphingomonas sp. BK580]|uniref:fimbrial biogenesis chaperone n=1 Tax=Sphingomonas sp. BK580 TaxID=2586972 RepID=UPI00161453AA|nr:molecular chaperone [Sphingomonas sp. BK580]MBB3691932.1 P pilus assembly chaperone PapD [Sphingomonas sp. BK580]
MPALTVRFAAVMLATVALAPPAHGTIVLSQVVVDFAAGSDLAQDIEVANDGKEIAYVAVAPFEITAPGTPEERRTAIVDPEAGGLLVSPQRLILQPGERRAIRIAAVHPRAATDRVYRVTVKPVAGPVSAAVTALKLLIGYDVLVIQRPAAPAGRVVGRRDGETLLLRNEGNTNTELYDGKLCADATPATCRALPSRRLYAGASWSQTLPGPGQISYRVAVGSSSHEERF